MVADQQSKVESPVSEERLDYINAIRGIAIILVVIVHTAQSIPNLPWLASSLAKLGQFGVQLFFVASALTLCLTGGKNRGGAIGFYIRRIFRIWPMYMMGIGIYAAIHFGSQWRRWPDIEFLPYTLINIVPNIFLLHAFVPAANNSIVPGGWSIGTEIFFYAIFPFFYSWVLGAPSNRRSLAVVAGRLLAIAAISQLILACLCFMWGMPIENNKFLYYSLPCQMVAFLLGTYLFALQDSTTGIALKRTVTIVFFALLCVIAGIGSVISQSLWPFIVVVVSSACFLLVYWAKKQVNLPKFFIAIGVKSYSIYILHFIFAWHGAKFVYRHKVAAPDGVVGLFWATATVLIFSYGIACITEKIIERPFINAGRILSGRIFNRER